MYTIFVSSKDVNNATSFYINLIKESIQIKDASCRIVSSLKNIPHDDTVVVITIYSFIILKTLRPFQKFAFWFQGIVPEELMMNNKKGLYTHLKILLFPFAEQFILRRSEWVLFVSNSMKIHFEKKYEVIPKRYGIVPCVNLQIDKKAFLSEKYLVPRFVYAGTLAKWQLFEETIDIFSLIKERLTNSELTIFTPDVVEANAILKAKGLNNVLVESVSSDAIQDRLKDYKYGFIIRENLPVNNVSTPTKINSYMSSGVIPIFSESISDFYEIASTMDNVICVKNEELFSKNRIVDKILQFENKQIVEDDIYNEYLSVFQDYFFIKDYQNRILKIV